MAALTAGTTLMAGCSFGVAEEIVGDDPVPVSAAAGPADSPVRQDSPAGDIVEAGAPVTALLADPETATLVAAVADPPRLLLQDLDDLEATPHEIDLPGTAARLESAQAGTVQALIPDAGALVEVDLASGDTEEIALAEAAVSTTEGAEEATVIAHPDGSVGIIEADGEHREVPGFDGTTTVVTAGGIVYALDRVQSSLVEVDLDETRRGLALRAGEGATNAVVDRFDRIIVTETRSGELLVFSADPFLLRQRHPVPGGPYALAYDEQRDLAWVTLTETNELVGFDIAAGDPVEKHRFPSVQQPNSVAIDQDTGTVVVGSATGEGIQVVHP
ncbi:YncE family protein [Actinoalloteichus hymeniacidonis]|nr:hypothetical protein [Actinoalloteichus hymeniacidonis]MBB5908279.1 hypothetical protein [Actinoalloteichus hymeniacidonis]